MPEIPLSKHFYELPSLPLSAQKCVNLYWEPLPEEGKNKGALHPTSGLLLYITLPTSPIYGLTTFNDLLFVVAGNFLYKVDSGGGYVVLGTLGTLTKPVIISSNRTQIVIVTESGAGYVANETTLTQISDPDYQDASSVTTLDGFSIFSKELSDQYFISSINNATAYDALEFQYAEESPDDLVRVFAFQGELWLFGKTSTEIHYNSGGTFPFVPRQNAAIQRGCAAKFSIAQEDNTIFWLGDDKIIYKAIGYKPQRVSTHAIEKRIESYSTVEDAEGFFYTEGGHKFYCLTFPTGGETFCLDLATNRIHQRKSFGLNRWRVSQHTFCYEKNLVGDYQNGNIYCLDKNVYEENGEPLERILTLPVIGKEDNRVVFSNFMIDFDTGVGTINGQGLNPQAMMKYSNDGGRTYSNELWRSIGKIGEYKKRAVWNRTGFARERVFEVTITDPVNTIIKGAYFNKYD